MFTILKRREEWERGTCLWREGGKDTRREEWEGEVKGTKWEGVREIVLSVCYCVCRGGGNLREEMGVLRVLSTPFSSSHSWEIWSTELGGTNTPTQINCCLENKSSFPFISLQCSISPCWRVDSELLCKRGSISNTRMWEKIILWWKKVWNIPLNLYIGFSSVRTRHNDCSLHLTLSHTHSHTQNVIRELMKNMPFNIIILFVCDLRF